MTKRTIPPALYDEVFTLVTAIAQPYADPLNQVDEAKASEAYDKLLELFRQKELAGESDPFLTEALADFTDDKLEAIRFYKLAIDQCGAFLGESTVPKRIGLARVLLSVNRRSEAQAEIEIARREAFAEKDSDAIKELDELAASLGAE
jgi:hypothetical protein